MKKLLITGFEAFAGEKINPSWEAISRLPNEIGEYTLTKLLIPVVFGKASEAVLSITNELDPDVILCIGQAGGRHEITPELLGINLRHAKIPDNEGNAPTDERLVPNGANAYFSTIPVRAIANAINENGIPSDVSYSAGAYVCNDLFYKLLCHFENTLTQVGFIHIPYCTEQNKSPSLPLDTITRALIIAIENLDS